MKLLDHVQRTALLLITGAFNTSPSCYLNILVGILPLDLTIRTSLRLKIASQWNNGGYSDKVVSHAFFLNNYTKNLIPPLNLLDIIPSRSNLNQLFTVSIEDRPSALLSIANLHSVDAWIGFTDGSVKNNLAGSGFAIFKGARLHHESSKPLGSLTTIFQAELHAITSVCNFLCNIDTIDSSIHICSDSKAAILAVSSITIRSCTVYTALSALNKLGANNRVFLHWCPSHSNVQGNDAADRLANMGSDITPFGREPFLPFSASFIFNSIDSHFRSIHLSRLKSFKPTTDFHSALIHSLFSSNQTIIRPSKDDTRVLTHIYTGFSYLRYFQHKIGNEDSSICKKCGVEEETTSHFLSRCPYFALHRSHIFGSFACSDAFLLSSASPYLS